MAYDPKKHHRRSIRLEGYDYRNGGAYFVTICTADRACVFGSVTNGEIALSRRGMIAKAAWEDIPRHRRYVELDQFVVMPNHIHGVFWIDPQWADRATQVSPLQGAKPLPGSVGVIVGAYKAAVSREINRLRPEAANELWQRNYYEHIIRDERSLETIREYIFTNPERWFADSLNPDGDGSDQLNAFLRSLIMPPVAQEGDTSVAPTQEGNTFGR